MARCTYIARGMDTQISGLSLARDMDMQIKYCWGWVVVCISMLVVVGGQVTRCQTRVNTGGRM